MAAAAATSGIRSGTRQIAPAPQLTNDTSGMTAEQKEAMRIAEEEADNIEAEERTLGVYEEKVGKAGRITKKPWYIIDPRTSKFVPYWDAVGMLALIYTAIVTTAEVAFVDSPPCIDGLFMINRGVDLIFFTDGILQFFLMYPQAGKSATDTIVWVHDQDKIAKHYLSTWLFLDYFSVGVSGFDFVSLDWPWGFCDGRPDVELASDGFVRPVEQLTEAIGGSSLGTLKVLRTVRVARLVKLIRLLRSSRIMKRLESRTAINYGHLALVKSLVGIVIGSHWFACLWGLMTHFEDGQYNNCWYVVFGYCQFDSLRVADAGAVQAAYLANPNDANAAAAQLQAGSDISYSCVPAASKYVAALYWAIMTITSIGYGDIAASAGNGYEQAWCSFLMLAGGMLWGSVIATFCGVMANLDPAGTEFRTTMDSLNRFMSLQGLPQQMRVQLREYFHQTRHLQIARANRGLIENMSPMLQGLVVWKVNEKWLQHVWFLRSAEDSFMVQLSLNLTAAVFAPAELCPHGYMYIVHRGIALYGGKVLTSGKVWGEDMILQSAHLRSKYAARCMTYVEVYIIGRDDLIALATRYPATLKLIRRSAFRIGFRREMIRRATDSIKARNKAAGVKDNESTADKMLVAVSSRKLDDEQAEQERAALAGLDSAFVVGAPGAEDDAPVVAVAAPSGGGGGGEVPAAVTKKIGELEARLMSKLESIANAVAKLQSN